MAPIPLCPVCGSALVREPERWHCENGHSFDVARQGYVNLLTVDRKHSRHPGDTRAQVAARRAFLDAGYYAPIARAVCELLRPCAPRAVLDAGCGEGYYLQQLGQVLPEAELWGVDISKDAVRYAAVRCRTGRFLTATAAHLPFGPAEFDCLLSMFALTEPVEFGRVLRPSGWFLQVLACEDHLTGLKRLIYPELLHRDKQLAAQLPGFRLREHRTLQFDFSLDSPEQIQNLLAMTPHFWRISQAGAARAAAAQSLQDTAHIVLNLYERECEEQSHAG